MFNVPNLIGENNMLKSYNCKQLKVVSPLLIGSRITITPIYGFVLGAKEIGVITRTKNAGKGRQLYYTAIGTINMEGITYLWEKVERKSFSIDQDDLDSHKATLSVDDEYNVFIDVQRVSS